MYKIGLIGKSLNHSFSKDYFEKKIKEKEILDFSYDLYEISSINKIKKLIQENNLIGLNVTYPYKEDIIQYVNYLNTDAKEIKAVNTIFINTKKSLINGYNTDWLGFDKSLDFFLDRKKIKALVLGSGGASKAICFALKKRGIDYIIISRNPEKNMISYKDSELFIETHKLIINTTLLGSGVYKNYFPEINYSLISNKHFTYDLAYNPTETLFLKKSKNRGAKTKNGYEMLKIQADISFEIWKNELKKCNV